MLAPRPLACLTLAITLTLSGCGNSTAPNGQKSPTPVGIVIIKAQTISVATELPGRTSPYLISEIRPQIGGIILQRLFREGAEVKVGEALYHLRAA